MANEHVFVTFVTLYINFSPHSILRLDKIMRVLGVSTTRIDWDDQCNLLVTTGSPLYEA